MTRLTRLASATSLLALSAPFVASEGRDPLFSRDSRWLAYRIGQSEAERTRLEKEKQPIRDGAGLRRLETGETPTWTGIRRFAFGGSEYLALLRYGEERRGEATDSAVQSADLIVRHLASGYALRQRDRVRLAGQQRVPGDDRRDAGQGREWCVPVRSASRAAQGPRRRARPPRAFRFDPAAAGGFPEAMRIAEHRVLRWSDDGERVFFGIQDWFPKGDTAAKDGDLEPADVEVWHWSDERIIPMQRVRKERDGQATYLAVWNLASGAR